MAELERLLPHLGEACKEARGEAGVRPTGVADLAGYNAITTITRFEKGTAWPRNPDVVVNAYAATTGVSVFDLWGEALDRARKADPADILPTAAPTGESAARLAAQEAEREEAEAERAAAGASPQPETSEQRTGESEPGSESR